jgi:hypothetical protein
MDFLIFGVDAATAQITAAGPSDAATISVYRH